ncbi:MAG: hypothetical protein EBX52_00825 [Proteobacteria bacterium]|nr:hypothetical protein [Pseudomonadota bacterium]
MKALILSIATALTLIGTQATAAQYQIYLAQPANPTTVPNEFTGLQQQKIYVDTTGNTVRIPMERHCAPGRLCYDSLRFATYFISNSRFQRGQLVQVSAASKNAQIEITANQNHSTLVVIRDNSTQSEASYVGSPAEAVQF